MGEQNELKVYSHFVKGTFIEFEIMYMPERLQFPIKSHLVKPHRTDFYHIFLFADCELEHYVDFEPYQIRPYSILFVDKGQEHHFDKLQKYKGFEIIFTESFFCITDSDFQFLRKSLLFNDFSAWNQVTIDKDLFVRYEQLVSDLQNEMDHPSTNNKHLILKNMLHNLLLMIQRNKNMQQRMSTDILPSELSLVMQFRDMLDLNFTTTHTVLDYAKNLSVTEKKLGISTKRVLGKLPKDMIEERVLLEAKRFLTHSEMSVKEICAVLGFKEQTNFTKFFKKQTSITPVLFRSNYLKMIKEEKYR